MSFRFFSSFFCGLVFAGCARIPPPRSPFPDAQSALLQLSQKRCGRSLQTSGKVDRFSRDGRFRADLLIYTQEPDRFRLDLISPFGVHLTTLTSDGSRFALLDFREKRFFQGPSSRCATEQMLHVSLPPDALVKLLHGQIPFSKESTARSAIRWDGRGYYVIERDGGNREREEIHLAPFDEDRDKPWAEQRLRLLFVQLDSTAKSYAIEFEGYRSIHTAPPRIDPDGLEPPLASGPACSDEIPTRFRLRSLREDEDLILRYDQAAWNPPLPNGIFAQPIPALPVEEIRCTH